MSLKEVINHYPNITAVDWVFFSFILILTIILFSFLFRVHEIERTKLTLCFSIVSIFLFLASNYYISYFLPNSIKNWQQHYLIPYLNKVENTKKEVKRIELYDFFDNKDFWEASVTLKDNTKYTGIIHLSYSKNGNYALYKKIDAHFGHKYPSFYQMDVNIDDLKVNVKNSNVKKGIDYFYPGFNEASGTSLFLPLLLIVILLLPAGVLYEFFKDILPFTDHESNSENQLEESNDEISMKKTNRIIRT
jgi:hypothetical protein